MLKKCYGDKSMSKPRVYAWYNSFKEGREEIEDGPRPRRPTTSTTDENINKIKDLVLSNRGLSIRDLANITGMSFGSIQSVLKIDFGLS